MVATSTAPYPYNKPLLPFYLPDTQDDDSGTVKFQTNTSLPVIDSTTEQAWRQVRLLLTGITTLAEIDDNHDISSDFSVPARVELMWDKNVHDLRGLVVFDSHGKLIVHVVNALLGYEGSGPELSKRILNLLGISDGMFEDIQHNVWHKSYVVIISRQHHTVIDGVDTAYPTDQVKSDWTWLRCRALNQA